MKGTEKQIRFAESIKAEFTRLFTYQAALGEKKTAWMLENVFSAFTDAAWWIENREMLNVEIINSINKGDKKAFAAAINKVFAQAAELKPELAKFKKK